MKALLLLLALGNVPHDFPPPIAHRHAPSSGSSPAAPYSFCAQLQAGDEAGSWGCVNGDLTAGASSTLTWSAVGSPTISSGTTCASPSKATFSATAWVKSSNTTFPAAAWSMCGYFDLTGMSVPYALVSFGDGANHYAMGEETNALFAWYGTTGGINTSPPSFAPVFFCVTSSGAGAVQLYFNGAAGSSTTGVTYADPGGAGWLFGSDSFITGYRFAGPFLGGFVTEKVLSGSDVSRLYHAVTCS